MIATIAALALIGVLLLLRALSATLWSQEAAGWVQALGSIAAIYGAFALSREQHRKDALAEAARRGHDAYKADNEEFSARTLAVRNLVQVAYAGLESGKKLIDHAGSDEPVWESEKYAAHIDQTRAVLDALVAPNTEHLALLTALNVSRTLNQVRYDMQYINGTKRDEVIKRCTEAINDAYSFVGRLANIQAEMIELCAARGIPIQIHDFRV